MAEDTRTPVGFKVGDTVYPFSDSDYDFDEIIAIETLSHGTIYEYSAAMEEAGAHNVTPPMRYTIAYLYVSMHRVDPTVTVADVLRLKDFDIEYSSEPAAVDVRPPSSESPSSDVPGGSDETSGLAVSESSESTTASEIASGVPV